MRRIDVIFLKDAALLAAVPFLPSPFQGSGRASKIKIIDWKTVDLPPDSQVFAATFQLNDTDQVRVHVMRIEREKTYSGFCDFVFPKKVYRQVIDGIKGDPQGDRRLDTVRITRFEPDGTAVQQGPKTVSMELTKKYEGLSPEEMLRQFQADRGWN